MTFLQLVTKISITGGTPTEKLRCTICLLPMQYQTKKDGKFIWQCFKCGKQYFVSRNTDDVNESWSPPR